MHVPAWFRAARDASCVLTIALFVAALAAPHVDELARDAAERSPARVENRNPEPWPGAVRGLWTARAWPERAARWYEDRMGLRDVLLRQKSLAYVFGFGVAPTSRVLLGREGMLFFTGDHTLEILRGTRPFAPRELEAFRALFEARDAWCREHGSRYLVVLGPNKEELYPELLPPWIEKLGPTRSEELRAYLARAGSLVEFVDLVQPLRAARLREGPRRHVYSRLGTHWDGLGHWAAYHAVASRIARDFPAVRPLEWEELEREPVDANDDSWARQMYVQDRFDPHSTLVRAPEAARRRRELVAERGAGTFGRSAIDDPALPRIVVNHDSFGGTSLDLLSEHAARALTRFDARFDAERIAKERPDFVIDWFVERILETWEPERLASIASAPLPRELVWALDPARAELELRPIGELRFRAVEGAPTELDVELASTGGQLELPSIAVPPGRAARLHVEFESPAATEFDLFPRRPGAADYLRRDMRTQPVARGPSEVDFDLDPAWLDAPLRIRPGRVAGAYRITALAVELVPRPAGSGAASTPRKE